MKTAPTTLIGLFLALFKGDCQFTIKAVDAASFKRSQNSPSRFVLAEVGRGTWTLRDWDSHDLARFLEAGEELSRLPDSGVDGQRRFRGAAGFVGHGRHHAACAS